MDETTRGHTTTFTRAARTRRMLDCLREGWSYRDVASVEGLSERRVRQIVGEHVRRFEPVDEDIHAALQVERLGFAVKMAGEALAKGDIRAIAPYIKAIDRLDAYQTRARNAAPQASHEGDALVVKMLVDRIERGVKAEMAAAAAGTPDPVAAHEPVIEAERAPPPTEPESPLAAEAPATAAEPTPPLAVPDGPLDGAPSPDCWARPSPRLTGLERPLHAPGWLAVGTPLAPPAPAPVGAPFAEPNMSNFAMTNYSPIIWP